MITAVRYYYRLHKDLKLEILYAAKVYSSFNAVYFQLLVCSGSFNAGVIPFVKYRRARLINACYQHTLICNRLVDERKFRADDRIVRVQSQFKTNLSLFDKLLESLQSYNFDNLTANQLD